MAFIKPGMVTVIIYWVPAAGKHAAGKHAAGKRASMYV